MSWRIALFLFPGLIIGLTIHEFAHAITAKWLGDRYPEKMGRVSLNPLRHLSLWGTLALFILGFGWGKPVPINLYNFKRPKLYYLLTSIAGPASNLILCAVSLGILYLRPDAITTFICTSIFFINAILAVINLLPVPPLDGSKIWPCIIPGMRPTISKKWNNLWIALLLIGLFSGLIGKLLDPVFAFLKALLPPQ
jgi:Zn-dependent protease